MNLVRGHRFVPGTWTEVKIETWVKGDAAKGAVAALLVPEARELVLPGIEPVDQVIFDGFAVYANTTYEDQTAGFTW